MTKNIPNAKCRSLSKIWSKKKLLLGRGEGDYTRRSYAWSARGTMHRGTIYGGDGGEGTMGFDGIQHQRCLCNVLRLSSAL